MHLNLFHKEEVMERPLNPEDDVQVRNCIWRCHCIHGECRVIHQL